jgi:NAD(P)H-hydrate epimerase
MSVGPEPRLRPFGRGLIGVPTGEEAAAFDRLAIAERGVPESALMESAGRAVADLGEHLAPRGPIVVLAGGGHNGGDAVVAARTLRARGREVELVVVGQRATPEPLLHGWTVPTVSFRPDADDLRGRLDRAALVVDGLLGTGLRAAPRAPAAAAIQALNASGVPVLSLDVPSGVIADSGRIPGEAVRAACTLAFGWPKLGSLIEPGRSASGRLVAAEIGFPPTTAEAFGACLLTPEWLGRVRPRRAASTHKNQVGAVLVVGGAPGMAGAVVLAARAALRSGAGFVRVASSEVNREVIQSTLPDAPFVPLEDLAAVAAALERSHSAVVGPGLAPDPVGRAVLTALLASAHPVVVDAGALTLLAVVGPSGLEGITGSGARVLTPHPGEMAALLGCSVTEVQADRPECARGLARRTGSTVVLKGAPTLIARAQHPLSISALASSDLAVAGMGDVLAGSIAAFLAQGLDPHDASGAALLVGAIAAHLTGLGVGMTASDILDVIPKALGLAGPGHTDLPFPWVTFDADAPS